MGGDCNEGHDMDFIEMGQYTTNIIHIKYAYDAVHLKVYDSVQRKLMVRNIDFKINITYVSRPSLIISDEKD